MRILFLCQYFPPEIGAPSARTFEHAREWVRQGHDVLVVTGFPNHPTGVVPPEYRGRLFQREEVEGIRVWRTWLWATPNENFAKRTLSYVSFMISAILAAALRRTRCDLVMATSPQFFVALAGYAVSRLKRRPFELEIRDLWPEGIVSVGLLDRDSPVTRFLERIELFLYRAADVVVTVTDGARDDIAARGIDPAKIVIVRNGADLSLFTPGPRDDAVRAQFGVGDRFCVGYVGTHGMTQGLSTALEAAARLQEKGRDDVCFLFVGEGAEKNKLVAEAAERELANVIFVDAQPRERMPGILCAGDACLVPLRKHKLFEGTIPSKLFEAMASGRPVLLGIEGEAEKILTDARAGIAFEPENAGALADAVERLADDTELARRLGASGAAFVRTHFDRSQLALQVLDAAARTLKGTP
ncbi:MAG: glycosyltransferase family 4 protein [Proteobacteria bacterium]|nr:glycosyltransferase family 4 protein [Pseudomonadota bacterium]